MIKLRTQQIIVDIPKTDSEPWILIRIQRIQIDDNGLETTIDRWGAINKKLSDVALDLVEYLEVVPSALDNQISIYGISDAIKEVAILWIIKKYGGVKNGLDEVIL